LRVVTSSVAHSVIGGSADVVIDTGEASSVHTASFTTKVYSFALASGVGSASLSIGYRYE